MKRPSMLAALNQTHCLMRLLANMRVVNLDDIKSWYDAVYYDVCIQHINMQLSRDESGV